MSFIRRFGVSRMAWNLRYRGTVIRCQSTVAPRLHESLETVKKTFKDDFNLFNKISLIEQTADRQGPIRIGLLTNDIRNKRLLETLLVDPFDVQDWYHDLKNRDLSKNNLIRVGTGTGVEIEDSYDIYNVSAVNDKFRNQTLEFLEVNDLKENDRHEVIGAQDLTTGGPEAIEENVNHFNCHFYIYIKSSPFEDLPNDSRFVNWPMFTILNGAARAQSEVVVDVKSAQKANELLIKSTGNSSEYTSLILASNLYRAIDLINSLAEHDTVIHNLVKTVVDQLYVQLSSEINGTDAISSTNYYKIKLQSLDNLKNSLTEEIRRWEQESHLELQHSVKPFCEKVMNPKFNEIVKILFKIDDINLIYENEILSKGFLTKSERGFGHLVGRLAIDSESSQENNAFDSLKTTLSAQKLPELQDSIHSRVLKDFYTIQLPTIAVCTVAHIFYDFEVNTLVATVLLAFVLTLNHISRKTITEFANLDKWYQEACRIAIGENASQLDQLVSTKIESDKAALKNRFDVIKHLEHATERNSQ